MPRRAYFELKTSADRKHYWLLAAGNGEVLCVSETYESEAMARKGIRAARRAAPVAAVRK